MHLCHCVEPNHPEILTGGPPIWMQEVNILCIIIPATHLWVRPRTLMSRYGTMDVVESSRVSSHYQGRSPSPLSEGPRNEELPMIEPRTFQPDSKSGHLVIDPSPSFRGQEESTSKCTSEGNKASDVITDHEIIQPQGQCPGPLREMASWLGVWHCHAICPPLHQPGCGHCAEPVYRAYPSGHCNRDHGVIRRCRVIFATDC